MCRAEAPDVEQFAREHADEVEVVGLGTQDDLDDAEAFVERFGMTITMLWDASFQSWANLGVSLQPSAMLLAPDGALLGKWLGPIDEDEVLELAAGAAAIGDVSSAPERFCRYAARYSQAHLVFEGVADIEPSARQRVFDDLRFAANAMSQTSPVELAEGVGEFARAVRELSQAAIDADLDVSAARNDPAFVDLEAQLDAAIGALDAPVEQACGTAWSG